MPSERRLAARSRRVLELSLLSYVVGATVRTAFELGMEVSRGPGSLLDASAVDVGMFLVWNLLGFAVWRPIRSAPGNLAVGLVAVVLIRRWLRTGR